MNISLEQLLREIELEHIEILNYLLSQRGKACIENGWIEFDDDDDTIEALDWYYLQYKMDIEELIELKNK